jgi:hypothetical protein
MSGEAARCSETARHNNALTGATVAAGAAMLAGAAHMAGISAELLRSAPPLDGNLPAVPRVGRNQGLKVPSIIPGSVDAVGWARARPLGLR